jgi:uncharacterized protein (DUF1697 family)
MTAFVALLRGINVSGQKQIRMADLQKSCEALGLKEVRSYLQSGNVVFCASRADPRKLAAALRDRIVEDFGHDVEVLVLPVKELNLVASSNPLWPRSGGEEKLFHGTFLFQPVPEDRFRKLKLPTQPGERAVLVGQVVLLYCPHGYGRTKLNNNFFEKALRVPATTRNWRTVLALKDLCAEQ